LPPAATTKQVVFCAASIIAKRERFALPVFGQFLQARNLRGFGVKAATLLSEHRLRSNYLARKAARMNATN
jgi:hypothetical protein